MEPGDLFDDDSSFRSPPPPDDRLWRHPSELGWPDGPARRRTTATLAAVSGLAGAVLAVGLLAATGSLGTRVESHEVLEREAVHPVVAASGITDDAADDLARAVSPSIVQLRSPADRRPLGAGVIFRDDGHVVTNAHVVGTATTVQATLANGHVVTARVIGTDPDTDLAVLHLDSGGPFVPAVLGTTDGIAVGDLAVVVGAGVSSGVVSAIGRDVTPVPGTTLVDMIQTDAGADRMSSGGAVLGADGSVIGITTAYAATSQLTFATPVDVARAVADDLLDLGHVRTVWLGLKGSAAPDGGGVAVAEVVPSGPLQQAGLAAGDVIRRVDGHPVASMTALRVVLRRRHPGDPVRVMYERNGRRKAADVVLAERPPSS